VDEILETRGQIQGRGALAAIERVRLTKTAVMDMLMADRELARKNGQSSAAIRATELIGIELGMFVTRTDNKHSGEKRLSQMPPEERQGPPNGRQLGRREFQKFRSFSEQSTRLPSGVGSSY